MKRILLSVLAGTVILSASRSRASGWEYSGFIGVDYSETAVSGNWEGSERDSRTWMAKADLSAEKTGPGYRWENSFKSEYGETSVSGESPQVSADTIDMESVYTRKLNVYLNPYGAVLCLSQFDKFFDPAVLGQSAGLGWNIVEKESQRLNSRLGAAARQRLETGEEPEHQFGAESVTNYSLKVGEEARFVSEMRLFSEFDGDFEMRWDSSLYFQLYSHLTARMGYLAIYPAHGETFPRDVQTRFTVGMGFSFNLI